MPCRPRLELLLVRTQRARMKEGVRNGEPHTHTDRHTHASFLSFRFILLSSFLLGPDDSLFYAVRFEYFFPLASHFPFRSRVSFAFLFFIEEEGGHSRWLRKARGLTTWGRILKRKERQLSQLSSHSSPSSSLALAFDCLNLSLTFSCLLMLVAQSSGVPLGQVYAELGSDRRAWMG